MLTTQKRTPDEGARQSRTSKPLKTPTAVSELHAEAIALAEEMERDYGPSHTAQDHAELRRLDGLAIDGKLTKSELERIRRKLLGPSQAHLPEGASLIGRPRSFAIDHSTGKVDPRFWEVPGYLARRKSILRNRGITRRERQTIAKAGKASSAHSTVAHAHLWRDTEVERQKTDAALTKGANQEPYRKEAAQSVLEEAQVAAERRSVVLRDALKANPETGQERSWAAILRRPEFDRSWEP